MISTRKRILAATAVAGMAFSLAACGSSNDSSTSSSSDSSSTTKASAPKPVASLDAIAGKTTAVKLDQGFADALTTLKLTPGVVGTAKLTDGSLVFPITGGNVTIFKKGQVSPYVIGQVQHEGSGFSLSAGDTKVEITNLNVDPGVSRVYGDVSVNGESVVTSAFIFQLRGASLKPLQVEGETAVLEGTKVFVS
ncbi:MAG: hypothetical protein JWO46_2178, partial [Nocardioidaceae bacterium]|nr:hypothetical protein [Nocardioidaceae bacterium]